MSKIKKGKDFPEQCVASAVDDGYTSSEVLVVTISGAGSPNYYEAIIIHEG